MASQSPAGARSSGRTGRVPLPVLRSSCCSTVSEAIFRYSRCPARWARADTEYTVRGGEGLPRGSQNSFEPEAAADIGDKRGRRGGRVPILCGLGAEGVDKPGVAG